MQSIKEPCKSCELCKRNTYSRKKLTEAGKGDQTWYCGLTGKDIIGPDNGEPCVNKIKKK